MGGQHLQIQLFDDQKFTGEIFFELFVHSIFCSASMKDISASGEASSLPKRKSGS
jgi:hypothetical protein